MIWDVLKRLLNKYVTKDNICFIFFLEIALQKQLMDTTGIVIFSIIVLHLLGGFGYLVYKLSPRKKEQ